MQARPPPRSRTAGGWAAPSYRWSSRTVPLRWRATAAALVCALHLAVFVPTIGDWSSVLVNDFAPQAQAIKGGDLPYRDQGIDYPPLSVPVLIAPIYAGDNAQDFVDGFQWEMLAFDLGIVVLIALALPGEPKRVLSALGIYTAGVVILSGVVLDPSVIDTAPLILARFDLVPALLVLAAVLAGTVHGPAPGQRPGPAAPAPGRNGPGSAAPCRSPTDRARPRRESPRRRCRSRARRGRAWAHRAAPARSGRRCRGQRRASPTEIRRRSPGCCPPRRPGRSGPGPRGAGTRSPDRDRAGPRP